MLALCALVVALGGLSDDARTFLRFGFGGVEGGLGRALRIAAHNAQFAGAGLVGAIAVPRLRRGRQLLDALLGGLLLLNAAVLGLALGAYGARLALAIAPQLPFELAALSLAGGAYLSARRAPLSLRALLALAAICALLLLAGALLETAVWLGGGR